MKCKNVIKIYCKLKIKYLNNFNKTYQFIIIINLKQRRYYSIKNEQTSTKISDFIVIFRDSIVNLWFTIFDI